MTSVLEEECGWNNDPEGTRQSNGALHVFLDRRKPGNLNSGYHWVSFFHNTQKSGGPSVCCVEPLGEAQPCTAWSLWCSDFDTFPSVLLFWQYCGCYSALTQSSSPSPSPTGSPHDFHCHRKGIYCEHSGTFKMFVPESAARCLAGWSLDNNQIPLWVFDQENTAHLRCERRCRAPLRLCSSSCECRKYLPDSWIGLA